MPVRRVERAIRSADWIIDLGPEGGEAGGQIIAQGTPEQVAQAKESYTGAFLRLQREMVQIPAR